MKLKVIYELRRRSHINIMKPRKELAVDYKYNVTCKLDQGSILYSTLSKTATKEIRMTYLAPRLAAQRGSSFEVVVRVRVIEFRQRVVRKHNGVINPSSAHKLASFLWVLNKIVMLNSVQY